MKLSIVLQFFLETFLVKQIVYKLSLKYLNPYIIFAVLLCYYRIYRLKYHCIMRPYCPIFLREMFYSEI